jgi:hydroxyacylglutathione hydrolase
MAGLEVHQFPCRQDNFGVLIHDAASGATAAIDAPEEAAVRDALARKGWRLSHILVTHKHLDHIEGIPGLKRATGCTVVVPREEAGAVAAADETVGEGETYDFAGHAAKVLATPGHTLGHIVYWFEADRMLFAGDTLFAMGCGRVIEGSFDQMWASLAKLRALPPDTRVYCGHEYTVANAKFALTVEPGNSALQTRAAAVEALRQDGRPTLPTTIQLELQTNPFLRPDSPEIQQAVGLTGARPAEVFAEVRRRKDAF